MKVIDLKKMYWSYLSLKKISSDAAWVYLKDSIKTVCYRNRVLIAGDFIYNNFGDDVAGIALANKLGAKSVRINTGMYAPLAKFLLIGAGGLMRWTGDENFESENRVKAKGPFSQYIEICPQSVRSGIVSAGFNCDLNSWPNKDWFLRTKEEMKNFTFIAIRDHIAYSILNALGVHVDCIIPDVALLSELPNSLIKDQGVKQFVLICPCAHTYNLNKNRAKIINIYKSIVNFLISRNIEVLLCPLQIYQGQRNDWELCKEIVDEENKNVKILNSVPSEKVFFSLCNNSMFVVSGRLHGAVLASKIKKSTFIIGYNYKQKAFAEALGMDSIFTNIFKESENSVLNKLETLYKNLKDFDSHVEKRMDVIESLLSHDIRELKKWLIHPNSLKPSFHVPEFYINSLNLKHFIKKVHEQIDI